MTRTQFWGHQGPSETISMVRTKLFVRQLWFSILTSRGRVFNASQGLLFSLIVVVAMGLIQQKSGFAAACFLRIGPEERKEQNCEGLWGRTLILWGPPDQVATGPLHFSWASIPVAASLIRSYKAGLFLDIQLKTCPCLLGRAELLWGYEGERDFSGLLHTEKQNQRLLWWYASKASLEKSSSYWERPVGPHCGNTGCLSRAALELYRLLFLSLLLPPAKYVTSKLLTVPKPQLSPLLKKKFSLSLFYEILYI